MQKSISVTDQPTNQPTHQPTDRVTYRVACTRLKRGSNSNKSTMTFSSKICQTLYEINEQKILCVPIIKNEFSDNSFKSLPLPYYHHANEWQIICPSHVHQWPRCAWTLRWTGITWISPCPCIRVTIKAAISFGCSPKTEKLGETKGVSTTPVRPCPWTDNGKDELRAATDRQTDR